MERYFEAIANDPDYRNTPPGLMGAIPDRPDNRDIPFDFVSGIPSKGHVDLRDTHMLAPVYDQGQMGSCTANAVASAFQFDAVKQSSAPFSSASFSPSRLFIWYYARKSTDTPDAVKRNVGCTLRDAIKTLDRGANGVCPEDDWSYEVGKFNKKTLYFEPGAKAAKEPPVTAEEHAHKHTATQYRTFNNAPPDLQKDQLIQCLDRGYPFVFGMKTWEMLSSDTIDSKGHGLRLPTTKEQEGDPCGHALLAVGYIEEQKVFIVRNSWGESFGENGYFYMPYDYLQHCWDFWTINVVQNEAESKGGK